MSRIIQPNPTAAFRTPTLKAEFIGGVAIGVCQDTDIAPGLDPQNVAANGQLNVGALCAMLNQQSIMLHAAHREIVALRQALADVVDIVSDTPGTTGCANIASELQKRAEVPEEIAAEIRRLEGKE